MVANLGRANRSGPIPSSSTRKKRNKKQEKMIGTELLRELVECVILTGRIIDIDPVSLLLIAAPESGKTSIVLERPCNAIEAFADVTGRGLHQIIKEKGKEITHIVINDLVAVLSHRQSVNKYTISQLNAYTEEGINALATPMGVERYNGHARGGVIASLTLDLAKDARMWWNKVGFTSRMLPFCYYYPNELNIKIKDSIDLVRGRKQKKTALKPFVIPAKARSISYPEKFAKDVRRCADMRSQVMKEDGKRRLKQYHALVQSHALWRSTQKPQVTEAEIDFLYAIDRYVSYEAPQAL